MGTDIHPYLEIRCNGKWTYLPISLHSDRNYELFGLLSGVRGDGPLVSMEVTGGLPDDVSEAVRNEWADGSWGHTPCVFGVEVLRTVVEGGHDPGYVKYWLQVMEFFTAQGLDEEDIRVIVWYDS